MKKVYISGPMTGLPEFNFPAFNSAAEALRNRGWEVVNPAEINSDTTVDWLTCIIADLEAMRGCTHFASLPRSIASYGSRVERIVAEKLGMRVTTVGELLS